MKNISIYLVILLIPISLLFITEGCGHDNSKDRDMLQEPDFIITIEKLGQASGSASYEIYEPSDTSNILGLNRLGLSGFFQGTNGFITFSIYLETPDYPFNKKYTIIDRTKQREPYCNSVSAEINGINYHSLDGFIELKSKEKDKITSKFEIRILPDNLESDESILILKGDMNGLWSFECHKLVNEFDMMQEDDTIAVPEDKAPVWTLDSEMKSPFCSQFRNMMPTCNDPQT